MKPIHEWHEADSPSLRERLETLNAPVVLRGLVRHWPAVAASLAGPAGICDYLSRFDQGASVFATKTRPAANGVMGYAEGLTDFNFIKARLPFATVIETLKAYLPQTQVVPGVAAQCAKIMETVPGFVSDNCLVTLPEGTMPNLWLGNALTVPAHHDHPHNIACVVAGHRRFTLFAPEQISNLYIGPLDYTPSGAPISVVDPHAPDFERYPRYRDAQNAAYVAELEPGDALYIPSLWWHQVEALDKINLLVNYWWPVAGLAEDISPLASLLQAIKALSGLSAENRTAWAAMFNHYLVQNEVDPLAHIPPERLGMLARPD